MPDFSLTPAGTRFLEGFAPAAYQGHTAGHLDLAARHGANRAPHRRSC
jgi:hypothetical protein